MDIFSNFEEEDSANRNVLHKCINFLKKKYIYTTGTGCWWMRYMRPTFLLRKTRKIKQNIRIKHSLELFRTLTK